MRADGGRPDELAGLLALGEPEPRWKRVGRAAAGLVAAAGVAGLVLASGSFAWGTARTFYGDVLPRLGLLLGVVIAARVLRRSRAGALLAEPDRGAVWRDRIAGLAEAGLVIAAVASALQPLERLLRRLAEP